MENTIFGRTYMDVPQEDGVVFIKREKELELGTFVNCTVKSVKDYDLIGEVSKDDYTRNPN